MNPLHYLTLILCLFGLFRSSHARHTDTVLLHEDDNNSFLEQSAPNDGCVDHWDFVNGWGTNQEVFVTHLSNGNDTASNDAVMYASFIGGPTPDFYVIGVCNGSIILNSTAVISPDFQLVDNGDLIVNYYPEFASQPTGVMRVDIHGNTKWNVSLNGLVYIANWMPDPAGAPPGLAPMPHFYNPSSNQYWIVCSEECQGQITPAPIINVHDVATGKLLHQFTNANMSGATLFFPDGENAYKVAAWISTSREYWAVGDDFSVLYHYAVPQGVDACYFQTLITDPARPLEPYFLLDCPVYYPPTSRLYSTNICPMTGDLKLLNDSTHCIQGASASSDDMEHRLLVAGLWESKAGNGGFGGILIHTETGYVNVTSGLIAVSYDLHTRFWAHNYTEIHDTFAFCNPSLGSIYWEFDPPAGISGGLASYNPVWALNNPTGLILGAVGMEGSIDSFIVRIDPQSGNMTGIWQSLAVASGIARINAVDSIGTVILGETQQVAALSPNSPLWQPNITQCYW